jgi:hypothetical protein
VSAAVVAQVEALGVDPVQDVHASGEVRPGRLDDQVVVRIHEAERVAAPGIALDDVREEREEPKAIVVVPEDDGAGDAVRGDVEEPVRENPPENASHVSDGTRPDRRLPAARKNRHTLDTVAIALPAMSEGLTLGHVGRRPGRAGPW